MLGDTAPPAGLSRELQAILAGELNPLFKIRDLVIVDHLPLNASNKLSRRALRDRHVQR